MKKKENFEFKIGQKLKCVRTKLGMKCAYGIVKNKTYVIVGIGEYYIFVREISNNNLTFQNNFIFQHPENWFESLSREDKLNRILKK